MMRRLLQSSQRLVLIWNWALHYNDVSCRWSRTPKNRLSLISLYLCWEIKQLSYLYSSLFFFSICSFPFFFLVFFLTSCNKDVNTDEPVKRWNLFNSSQCSRTHNVRNKAAAFLYAAVFSQEEGIWWALKGLGTESKLKNPKSLTEKTQFLFHPGTELRKKVNAMRPQAVVFLIFLLQQSYNHFHPSLQVYNTLWALVHYAVDSLYLQQWCCSGKILIED